MKRCFPILLFAFVSIAANAQILKRITDRIKQKSEQKVDDKIDKTIDKTMDGNKNQKTALPDSTNKNIAKTASNPTVAAGAGGSAATPSEPASLKSYSKFDFIPGDKIIAFEDFSQDNIGDFPDKWNTNSSAEVVTVEGKPGKWMKFGKEGAFYPEFITSLPENFTLQFDLGVNPDFNYYSTSFRVNIARLANPKAFVDFYRMGNSDLYCVRMEAHPTNGGNTGGSARFTVFEKTTVVMTNETANVYQFHASKQNFVTISIWRQKQRVRMYINEEKVFDLPKAFSSDIIYNGIVFSNESFANDKDHYYLSNIRLAVGAPDTRNKLITEGKYVTRGILFDVNSDQIKPESYGTLKDIANVLTENSTVRVKIIGHTDSDGDDKSNLELSKRRAESVKNALIKEFGIEGSRLDTDGKGESQPVDKNDTPAGKANNRRVEFIKL